MVLFFFFLWDGSTAFRVVVQDPVFFTFQSMLKNYRIEVKINWDSQLLLLTLTRGRAIKTAFGLVTTGCRSMPWSAYLLLFLTTKFLPVRYN